MSDDTDRRWNPFSAQAEADQTKLYDRLRRECPVAHGEGLGWTVFRHQDVMRILEDPGTFSNAVSAHLSVPNGMDPPHHTAYRRIIEPYFAADRMAAIEPRCRSIAADIIAGLPTQAPIEFMSQAAEDFALQAQCAFLGWPAELHVPLRDWVRKNHAAIRSRDRTKMAEVAMEFDTHIRQVLDARRSSLQGTPDVASQLIQESVENRTLSDEEIVSILRNWTVGELATIAASIGILVHYLASHPDIQTQLRDDRSKLGAAIDEILRIDAPLMTARRIANEQIELSGQCIARGERIALMWSSANRDESVFGDPDEFNVDRDPTLNLLYGAGIHVCPGAPLARLELRVFMEELLDQTRHVELAPGRSPMRAVYPAAGFATLPVVVQRSD